jgi:nitrate/nitrite-specific signal transduction histidine kinase
MMATPYRTSHVAASLRAGNRVIGALCVGNSAESRFSDKDRELLTRLADVAAIALENARLYEQAERTAILEQRQILAAEMHDGLAQTLNFVHMMIDLACDQVEGDDAVTACTTLERGRSALDQAASQARGIIANLQDDLPAQSSLQRQLQSLIEECSRNRTGVEWVNDLKSPVMMSSQDTEQVLRVVREAILNAQKHSQATWIRVRLSQKNGDHRVTVTDDGHGFDLEGILQEDQRNHFGLSIMHARAARIGGKVTIDSEIGRGTQVVLSWPCGEKHSEAVA